MKAVETFDIKKSFGSGDKIIEVLHGINLVCPSEELTMIVGPSGCGKTTLLSIFTGILSPTSGTVKLFDHDITAMTDQEKVLFRRENIGFIFQQFNLLPALTAAENAAIPLVASGTPLDEAAERAEAVLSQMGMEDQCQKLPKQLSGGQQQRVAIARALVHRPRLIVCDEPTASLDAATGQSVMENLKTLARDEGAAVIVVTHDNRIFHFADRVVEMSDGRIIAEKNHEDLGQ